MKKTKSGKCTLVFSLLCIACTLLIASCTSTTDVSETTSKEPVFSEEAFSQAESSLDASLEEQSSSSDVSEDEEELVYDAMTSSFTPSVKDKSPVVGYRYVDDGVEIRVPNWEQTFTLSMQSDSFCGDVLQDTVYIFSYDDTQSAIIMTSFFKDGSSSAQEQTIHVESYENPTLFCKMLSSGYGFLSVFSFDSDANNYYLSCTLRTSNHGETWKPVSMIDTPQLQSNWEISIAHYYTKNFGFISCESTDFTDSLENRTFLTFDGGRHWTRMEELAYPLSYSEQYSSIVDFFYKDGMYRISAQIMETPDSSSVKLDFHSYNFSSWYWVPEEIEGEDIQLIDYTQDSFSAVPIGAAYDATEKITPPMLGEEPAWQYIIRTPRELQKLFNKFYSQPYAPVFGAIATPTRELFFGLEHCDQAFFEEKSLVVVLFKNTSARAVYNIESLYITDNKLHIRAAYGIPSNDTEAYGGKTILLVAEVNKADIASIEDTDAVLYKRNYNNVASLEPFIEDHQTPEDLSVLQAKKEVESILKVSVADLYQIACGDADKNDILKQAGFKIWIIDANGNKLDYVFTNSNGVAAFVMRRGYYTFYFEGDEQYLPQYSKLGISCPDSSHSISNTTYIPTYSLKISTYPREYETLNIYVTDVDTGEPLEGICITHGSSTTVITGYTDKDGVYSAEGFLSQFGPLSNSNSYYLSRKITFTSKEYDYFELKSVSVLETEIHVQLKKTVTHEFTVKFIDAKTGEPLKGVKCRDYALPSWSDKSHFSSEFSNKEGIIRITVTEQDLGKDCTVTFYYPNASMNPMPIKTIVLDTNVTEYVLKIKILTNTYEWVE